MSERRLSVEERAWIRAEIACREYIDDSDHMLQALDDLDDAEAEIARLRAALEGARRSVTFAEMRRYVDRGLNEGTDA